MILTSLLPEKFVSCCLENPDQAFQFFFIYKEAILLILGMILTRGGNIFFLVKKKIVFFFGKNDFSTKLIKLRKLRRVSRTKPLNYQTILQRKRFHAIKICHNLRAIGFSLERADSNKLL